MEASQIQDGEPRRLVMSAPIPLRQDFDASQLRGLARRSKDGRQARRLLALAAIYDGATRTEAAKIGGVGLQIIRDWVLRFNARGHRVTSVPPPPTSSVRYARSEARREGARPC